MNAAVSIQKQDAVSLARQFLAASGLGWSRAAAAPAPHPLRSFRGMRRAAGGTGRARALLIGGLGVLGVLALAQLILPRIAASRISSRLGRYGRVESVHVSAWPAIELLWGDAGSVRVRAGALAITPAQADSLLAEAGGTQDIDLSADSVAVAGLSLSRVSFSKRGSGLSAEAHMSQAQVQEALPPGVSVQLIESAGGGVLVRAEGGLFGLGASLDVRAQASEGRLVARPVGALLGGLQLTLFSDPRVYVEGVGASAQGAAAGGGAPPGYELTMSARLR